MTDSVARTLELDEAAPLSEQLVRAVAEREGVDPTALETPLYESIDPDALDRLFRPTESADRTGGRVEFRYHGYRVVVTVGDDAEVRLEDEDADSASEPVVGEPGVSEPGDEPTSAAVHFCLDCGWRAAARDGYSAQRRSRMAIEHYVQTGHPIDSSRDDPADPI